LLSFHFLSEIFAVWDFFYFATVFVKGVDEVQVLVLEVVFVAEVNVDWFIDCFEVWGVF
jgi:hypothetical protein